MNKNSQLSLGLIATTFALTSVGFIPNAEAIEPSSPETIAIKAHSSNKYMAKTKGIPPQAVQALIQIVKMRVNREIQRKTGLPVGTVIWVVEHWSGLRKYGVEQRPIGYSRMAAHPRENLGGANRV